MNLRASLFTVLLSLGSPLAASADVVPPEDAAPATDAGGTPAPVDAGSPDGDSGGCAASPTGGAPFALVTLLGAAALWAGRRR